MWRTATSTRATPLATTKARRTLRYQALRTTRNIADPDKAHQRFIRTSNPTTTIAATGSALARLTPAGANTIYQTTATAGSKTLIPVTALDLASNHGRCCVSMSAATERPTTFPMRRLTTPSLSTTSFIDTPGADPSVWAFGPQSMAGQFRPGNCDLYIGERRRQCLRGSRVFTVRQRWRRKLRLESQRRYRRWPQPQPADHR